MAATARLNMGVVSALMSLALMQVSHAHHSHASLDRNNIQQHRGVVTKYSWRMPHVFIQAEAPNPDGKLVTWSIELLHPPGMKDRGWSRDSFKPGDTITWEGPVDKDPDRYYAGLHWAEKADGTRLLNDTSTVPVVTVEPSTDLTGTWTRDTKRVGFTYYPPEDWPYTQKGKELVAQFEETQNPQLDCEDPGPPKSTTLPYPIVISRPAADTFVFDYDMRDQQRVIKLDQDIVVGEPSKVGQSTGRMEGGVLIVETTNFSADRWGSFTGVDSSAEKHLVERYSLTDGGMTLRVQMTLTDPVYLSEPVEIDWYLRKLADRELLPVNCTLESARLYIEAGYQ
jgi:hypothetical protein